MVDHEIKEHDERIKKHQETIDKTDALLHQTIANLKDVDRRKVELSVYEEFLFANENKILDLKDECKEHENSIKSLENYVEKYVPCKTQNLIIENLKLFCSKEVIARLKSQSNKV